MKPAYDTTTLALLRRALEDVLIDPRFLRSKSISALEVAEHILSQAARGERDIERMKASVLGMMGAPLREAA
ncbi:MAG: hypothetical protein JWP84_4329 [Tardiphaga sp.]|nr:hypothetical protein [Tardiphaga sp.]